MRHRNSINHLSRKTAHRKAMLANMATSLILHKRINTTLAKAKALRGYIEPLITKSKEDTTHSRRMVFSYLQSKEAVTELFREVSVKVADRPGGYTRIIKTGARLGDNAEMCMMELVDFNETMLAEKQTKAKTARKRRGGGKKKGSEEAAGALVAADVVETAEVIEEPKAEAKVEEVAAEQKTEEVKTEKPVEPVAEVKEEAPEAKVEEETKNTEDNTKEQSN
ncbi:MAG: 50S ribosomal protein L17 [Bacteroidales bacterium]